MDKRVKRFYWSALLVLIVLSSYPIVMGARVFVIHMMNGSIQPEDYANYVIPYTAVCLSILIGVILYPLISRLKRFSIPVATMLTIILFLGIELYIESITLNSPEAQSTLQWQLASCIGTTAAMQAFQKLYDNTFKIHYFLISFTIILLVIGIVYSYGNVMLSKDKERKNILRLQIVCTVLFIAFCIVANFTAFFREAVDYLSPLSSILTGAFFVVLGLTAGAYLAGFLTGRSSFVSVGLPSIGALMTTSAMYYGEYKLLNGVLYRFGYSQFFQPLPFTVVAPVDIMVILVSGGLTALVVGLIHWLSPVRGKHYKENIEAGRGG